MARPAVSSEEESAVSADSDMDGALDILGQEVESEHHELLELRARLLEAEVQIGHLKAALDSARTIGMAMGIIMERAKCTPEEAFNVLAELSQQSNIKLRLVADQIVFSGEYEHPDNDVLG